MHKNNQYTFKVIILGDSCTGKTTFFKRIFNQEIGDYRSTIGVDFKIKELKINEKNIKLQLWDTAGQERFRSIISSFYRGNDCAIFFYDITDRNSFNNIKNWIKDCNNLSLEKKMVKILIGNKTDNSENRKINYEEGLNFSKENDMEFFEISAVNEELDHIIITITNLMIARYEEKSKSPEIILSNNNYYIKNIPYLSKFCN